MRGEGCPYLFDRLRAKPPFVERLLFLLGQLIVSGRLDLELDCFDFVFGEREIRGGVFFW